jgi:hypothetical protein
MSENAPNVGHYFFLSDALFLMASAIISGFFSAIKGRKAHAEMSAIAEEDGESILKC